MILIADSGSTKCSWAECSINSDITNIHNTVGLNPKYTTTENLLSELKNSSLFSIKKEVTEIYFYGAGCSSEDNNKKISVPLSQFFANAKIVVKHDMEAAVKATFKGAPIISCILGTGSNSCFYDGNKIYENAPSLGYILGDEGSGNYFGKQLINLYVNKKLPVYLVSKLEKWTNDKPIDMIEKIYSLEKPNLYLAAFFKFMYENKQEEIFDNIFREGIKHFFNLHIKCFEYYKNYQLTFVGSVAFYLSEYIYEIAEKEEIQVQEIIQSPIESLVSEHFNK
ncbi:MAG: N-acetylglucosamine kinase [Flavobacteriales bacterium]|nr:N-acetylglucosamine kinase [Flavobacteriales bacterium]